MKILKKWSRSLYKRLLKHSIVSPKVVVLLDGGICSQMHQYLLGQLYKKQGCEVVYDLSFYKKYGMDKDCKFVRNFDLLKAFPYLELHAASQIENEVYEQKYYYEGNNTTARLNDFSFLTKKAPLYLGGYYHLPNDIWLPAFHSIFKLSADEVLNKENLQIYHEIEVTFCSVAVHVRRGDLKVEMYDYGKPASLDYFKIAVRFFQERMNPFFYFFSDESDWVTKELIPTLQLTKNDCRVVNVNGSDKGYMDLFLIAKCQHQITSKGTLGKYGAVLGDYPGKIVVFCDDEIEYCWKGLLQNPVFL